jgi:selenocysteine-specific elongation factor
MPSAFRTRLGWSQAQRERCVIQKRIEFARAARRAPSKPELVDGITNAAASDPVLASAPEAFAAASQDERERAAVLNALAAAGIFGLTAAQIGTAANLDGGRTRSRIAELLAAGAVRELHRPRGVIAAGVADELLARALVRLRERHAERPWLMGLASLGLAQTLGMPEAALVRVLAEFVADGRLSYRGGYYSTAEFSPRLNAEQQCFFDTAFAAQPETLPAPVRFAELRARIKSSSVPELRQAFDTLVASGALSKVGDLVYLGSQIAAIRAQLEAALERHQSLSVAQFRTLTGTSRKYAVPLLEFFDATGVTLRSGDLRVRRPRATQEVF